MMREIGRKNGLPLAGLALATLLAVTPAQSAENIKADATIAAPTDVAASFTIYVGGLLFISGNFEAVMDDDNYRLAATMSTAGTTRTFYPADYKLSSEGRLTQEHVQPHHYVSDTQAERKTRKITMSYSRDGMPRLTAEPPYNPGDLDDVMPSLQQNTLDPISAFIMPVVAGENPCDRTIPVFDGKRRYDLKLVYEGEKQMTPRGLAKPVTAIVCTIRYVAVAPIERRKFTDMLRRNDDMRVWLAPFDGGRVYMPVRFQLRTPLGGAVMELTQVKERLATREPSPNAKTKTAMK